MRPLSRRSLFALPVALPAIAMAASIESILPPRIVPLTIPIDDERIAALLDSMEKLAKMLAELLAENGRLREQLLQLMSQPTGVERLRVETSPSQCDPPGS